MTKSIFGPVYESLPKGQEEVEKIGSAVRVSLSSAARTITTLLKNQSIGSTSAAAGFDEFLENMHSQILADGKDAKVLTELPKGYDPGRNLLAKQAANYLFTSLYGGEKIHDAVSSKNPFSALDRARLSQIAFDDSGAFTSVERDVAFLEMTNRDTDFQNRVWDFQSSLRDRKDTTPWHQILSNLAHSQMASSMSEGEKSWRGWGSVEAMFSLSVLQAEQFGVKLPDLPAYANLGGPGETILVVTTDKDGTASWASISVERLASEDFRLALLDAIGLNPEDGDTRTSTARAPEGA